MATGISIHVGLNEVDPAHYGTSMPLVGCVNDARAMAAIADAQGFASTCLHDGAATSAAVRQALRDAQRKLGKGDILMLTYSGHGGRVEDTNIDENDGWDETWCLYDRQMPDDELYGQWAEFAPGVRILVISDSCHSGTVIKFAHEQAALAKAMSPGLGLPSAAGAALPAIRALSTDAAESVYHRHAKLYRDLQDEFSAGRTIDVHASVLLVSACRDWELARDGTPYGVFTTALLKVWNGGKFPGTYLQLQAEIYRATAGLRQRPNFARAGVPCPAFETQRAFTI